MSISKKSFFIIGLALTTVGSFLPWQVEGDFLFFRTFGIQIFPSFEDNGGLMIVLLSTVLASLIFSPPVFIKKAERWVVIFSVIITFASIYYVARWFVNLLEKWTIVGAPSLQMGLIMVLIGSFILLITSLLHDHKAEGTLNF